MAQTIKLTQMVGTVTLGLCAETQNEELFRSVLNADTLIDAKLSVLTHEGEIVEIPVTDILDLQWKVENKVEQAV